MSTKLKGSLYIDDDIKLIYHGPMYKIFIDDHCTEYEIYDSGNSVTGYIRLFILNKAVDHINVLNNVFVEIDRINSFIHIDRDNMKDNIYLTQLLESEEVKEVIYSYFDESAGY